MTILSSQTIPLMKMFASLTAKTTSVPSAPIIHVKAITLRDRMSTIPDLHPEAASLILDSEYTDLNGRKIPLTSLRSLK